MLVFILVVGVFVAGVLLCIYDGHNYNSPFWVFGIGITSISVGVFGILAASACLISVQVDKDVNYQNALYEKEVLEYRLESVEENNIGNELLYNDIIEFNNELRVTKKWANNFWVNWFYNQDIATIDYIDLKGD